MQRIELRDVIITEFGGGIRLQKGGVDLGDVGSSPNFPGV